MIGRAEALGFAAVWVSERAHNPFFSLTIAAKETEKIQLGAYRTAAFPRSPMITAQIAWDLARQSSGRFRLGLSAPSDSLDERSDGVERMREYLESLRAIWNTFQTDERLRYRGEYYTFRLMAPFFNPGPIDHPEIPIWLAGLNPGMAELAGACCQGLHAGEFHTADYIKNVVKPSVAAGLLAAGRAEADFSLAVPVLAVSGFNAEDISRAKHAVKLQIAAAADTGALRRVAAHHNWNIPAGDGDKSKREAHGYSMQWQIPDGIVEQIAVVAQPQDLFDRITERYAGLADRVILEMSSENIALIEAISSSGTVGR